MDQTHLHTTLDELGDKSQKRLFLSTHLHIKVFDVSCANPKSMLHRLNSRKHFGVVGGVGDESEHYEIFIDNRICSQTL